ncbi:MULTISPECIES: transglycosylase domain-containing protein [unclassified Staphylococcus]|uniref:transglycosylase domain-containing protein n=1 Tax=unclassified Staphylococcus TaxID=91994 RepID=UPI0021D1B93A|nr:MULTISPECIES: transglycosylase domain-containing protein [unclassified Staphylococcus]UXR79237.1 penicillin-binding protein [Staphylococcus sp. IVB6227]UXR83454.1 penicillin-binding protein [Staphylococcus sp. IVB6214]
MTEKKAASNGSKKKSGQKKNKNIKRTLIKVISFLVLAFVILALVGVLLFAYYAWKAPAFNEAKLQDPSPAKIYDQNDNLVKTLDNGARREHVDLKDVPDQMKDAVLATEDNRFYDHGALDYKRLFGAVIKNVTGGFGSQGASTLTQQVVKRTFLTDQKSIERKAQEAYLSYRLEQEYSKDEIFQMYLNKIYYSDGVYGVKAAAKYYFDKDLKDLNLAESAYLAGLPQVPNTYNIYDYPEEAEKRKDTVLYLMNYHNRISDKEMKEAQDTSITENLVDRSAEDREIKPDDSSQQYDSYINFVKQELMSNDEFKGRNLSDILNSGIKIYTYMDKDVQTALQSRVDNGGYYKNDEQQVGASIVDSESGSLTAISGGRNYKDVVQRNQATDVHPTGSSLKPFLAYAPAIDNLQWATNHSLQDESVYYIDGGAFRNYDQRSHGVVTIYDALRQSFNIPALKTWQTVKEQAGNSAPTDFAAKVGLEYENPNIGPSEVLGGSSSEFSPVQLASAYASFANGGTYNKAHSIKKVVEPNGNTIEFEHTSHQAMNDYTAYMITQILEGTFDTYGSAYGNGISGVNVAAKTGTGTYGDETYAQYSLPSSAAKDVWISGYSPRYTMSVWMGFGKVKEYGENSFVGSSEQKLPQYLFRDVMGDINPQDGKDFNRPASVGGSGRSLYVAQAPDGNTTSNFTESSGGTNSNSNNKQSNQNSNNANNQQQGNNNGGFLRNFLNN